jgi:tetratricopeptide (TPR) repeat protein
LTRTDARLGMLEPIREFAAEQLASGEDAASVRLHHARYFCDLAGAAGPALERAARPANLAPFVAEGDNLRAAIASALAHGDGDLALSLVTACAPWLVRTDRTAEGRALADAALAMVGDAAPTRCRAQALAARAQLCGRTAGAFERQHTDLLAALALWRKLDDVPAQARHLTALALAETNLGRPDGAVARADQALELAHASGDEALLARAVVVRAALEPGLPDAATRVLSELPTLLRADELNLAVDSLISVGYVALAEGRLDDARRLLEEAVPLVDTLANSAYECVWVYENIGLLHLFAGENAAATGSLYRSLEAARSAGYQAIHEALFALAAIAAWHGDDADAARLAGAASARVPAALLRGQQQILDVLNADYVEPARQRFGEKRWDEFASEGAALEQAAIELGLSTARRRHVARPPESPGGTLAASG